MLWFCVVSISIAMSSSSCHSADGGSVLLPPLNFQQVSSVAQLQQALEPLLLTQAKTGVFSVSISAVKRDDGSWTKSFSFFVGLRALPDQQLQALFKSGRVEPERMSVDQRASYDTWSEEQKETYSCLYSAVEQKSNVKQCRNVYNAWNKKKNTLPQVRERQCIRRAAERLHCGVWNVDV